ncbi:putative quinol monooxygenase [Vibrio sp. WJH972]
MLNIVAFITPKVEFYQACKDKITNIVEATRAEDGCLRFEVYEEQNTKQLVLVETWVDHAALEEHYAQPYITPIFEYYQNALEEAPQIYHLSVTG